MRRFVPVLAAGVVGLLGLVPATASAEPPIKLTRSIDITVLAPFTSGVCGFDVYQHVVGTSTITALKRNGAVVREIDGAHNLRYTWFAPSEGTSYSYAVNGPERYTYPGGAALGSPAVLTFNGLNEKVPGAPASAGQQVYYGIVVGFDGDGIPFADIDFDNPVKLTGSYGPTVEDRCRALTSSVS